MRRFPYSPKTPSKQPHRPSIKVNDMKLYYSKGACSLAPHIVAKEAGVPVELVQVDLASHTYAGGKDYFAVNPRGYVPLLELDSGERMTEASIIVQYLADQGSNPGLLPKGGIERIRVQEWLNFIATELHKVFSPWLWHKEIAEGTKDQAKKMLARRFEELNRVLEKQPFLLGGEFTVADAYAFTILNWANFLHLDLSGYPHLRAYLARVASRPAVAEVLREEHLPSPAA